LPGPIGVIFLLGHTSGKISKIIISGKIPSSLAYGRRVSVLTDLLSPFFPPAIHPFLLYCITIPV